VVFGRKVESGEFEAIALPHLNELYRTAVHLVRDRTEAQDLVQEAYLQAWKGFHRFQPGTNCRAWLFKILINEIRHYRRRWFNAKTVVEGEQSLEQTLPFEPPIGEDIRDEDVLAALDGLPREFREVVLLADVQEFSYKEIADMVGIPVGTVMSRLNRGRKQLRVGLAEYAAGMGMRKKLQENAYERR
jgi:RNA polymerase sigma-70 factor (ECF subfamily)